MKRDLYRSIRLLRDHKRGIQPDPSWVRDTRERLLMQVRNTIPSAEAANKNRETIAAAHPSFMQLAKGPVLVVGSIVLIVLGGSFASVRAAEHSLPGDALYLLKLVTEQTRLAFTSSKPNKVKLKVAFTKRRVEDMKTVMAAEDPEKDVRVGKAADILKQDLNTIKEQLDEVHKQEQERREVAETTKVVEKEVAEVVKKLKEAKTDIGQTGSTTEVKKKVSDAQAQAADVGITALELLVEVQKEPDASGVVSEEDIDASLAQQKEAVAEVVAEALQLMGSATSTETDEQGASTSSSTDSGAQLVKDAEETLLEVQSLIDEDRVDEAVHKLKEASVKSFLAQSQVEEECLAKETQAGEQDQPGADAASVDGELAGEEGDGAATSTEGASEDGEEGTIDGDSTENDTQDDASAEDGSDAAVDETTSTESGEDQS